WVLISAATCPERPVTDDIGPVCGTEAPDGLFAYDTEAGRWSTLEIPRRPEAGIGQVVSITGATATVAHRRSYDDSSVAFSTLALDAEELELMPRGDVAATQCSIAQVPPITFSDPEFRVAHLEASDGVDARTVELSGEAVPLVITMGEPRPSCYSARDLLLLPGRPSSTESTPGFRYSVYRLDGQPTEVASGEGLVTGLVAGPDWFAVTDDRATVLRDREGKVIREIPNELMEVPVAAESGLVLVGSDGRSTTTTLRVEAVR
ncbi:MAG TPA: hypothetical protein VK507_13375, partial [Iamia sp.]|nr:hypothetical protein [Iamia sp.]